MKKLSPNAVTMHEGAVVLYQRERSSMWQMRYKAQGRWIRTSTKKSNLVAAKAVATDIYLNARFKEKEGLPIVSKQFAPIAETAKKRMRAESDAGHGKAVYKDYISAIDNYLIPFFGKHFITKIDYPLLKQFAIWRTEKAGRELKANTQNTHNCAMRRVFDVALELKYVTRSQIPELATQGDDSERRPDFTADEYLQLLRLMRPWSKDGRMEKSRQIRALLFEYVQVLALTGMRHGTEAESLNWRTISPFTKNGRQYVEMYVNGKRGLRPLVAKYSVMTHLRRLHAMAEDLKHLSFENVLEQKPDKLVFRLPDGKVTKHLDQPFKAFLTKTELLTCKRTGQDRTLYSLRHMFATNALIHGTNHYDLAVQMGTSVTMIEKHYAHVTPRMRADKIVGIDDDQRSVAQPWQVASGPNGQIELKPPASASGQLKVAVDTNGVVKVEK